MRKSDIKDTTKPQKTAKKAVTSPKSVPKSKEQAQQTAEIATLNQTSLQERVLNFDLVNALQQWCQKADKPFWTAFFTAFIVLNLIFLYHGAQFLFGDHDWRYLKEGITLGAGLFEARFTQFIPINILSRGEIYPIINNLLGFAGFSLGTALLARYWNLPHHKKQYALFALFCAITPYILSFMYFAFLIVPVLGWNAFIIGSLVISEKEEKFSFSRTFSAIVLIIMALGGYPPVINLIAVVISIKLLSNALHLSPKTGLKDFVIEQFKLYKWTLLNIILGIIGYKLCLFGLEQTGAVNTSYYNLQTTPIAEWGNKFILVSQDVLRQFIVTLPFITTGYKTLTALLVILGLCLIIKRLADKATPVSQKFIIFALTIICLYAPLVTLFISTSLAETEFSPRIDFFGLMYLYAGFFALIQSAPSSTQFFKNLGILLAVAVIFVSTNNLFEAEKVWKLGFESEMKLFRRAGARFMSSQAFSLDQKYIMVQGGVTSYRPRFYHETYDIKSDDLLNISYVPTLNPGVMWNYYAPKDFAIPTSYQYILQPDEATINQIKQAQNWPHKNSTIISVMPWQQYLLSTSEKDIPATTAYQPWIMLLSTENGAESLRRNYGL